MVEGRFGVDFRGGSGLDGRTRLAEGPGLGVDGEGGLVAEEVARHGRQDEGQLGRHGGNLHRRQRGGERLALSADNDRGRLVRPVDGELLGDVLGVGARDAGCAHEDERLGRQIDVLLVLCGVAGDRLVTELGELDADLGGSDPVRAVAHDRPVPPCRRVEMGRLRELVPARQDLLHGVGETLQAGEQVGAPLRVDAARLGQGHGQQRAGSDLCVERLRGRHAHLDVAAVGRVDHTVGLLDQVAVATVDDGDDKGTPRADEVDGAVGVRRRARLADGDDHGVRHVVVELEARQLGGGQRRDRHRGVLEGGGKEGGNALAGDRSRALADDDDAPEATVAQAVGKSDRHSVDSEDCVQ